MLNSFSSSANSWQQPNNIVESLNQVMDNISVLSDSELQQELSIFANAEFVYDMAPGRAATAEEKKKEQPKKRSIPPNMHSLLNVKLASLAENNYHTYMSPDAINRFYENESPDCTPPNGYYSPNPTPPNGFYSPNPTPPNGVYLNHSGPSGFQGIVNPPITFYDENDEISSAPQEDEDDFIKTMRILTSSNEEIENKRKNSVKISSPLAYNDDDDSTTITSSSKKQMPLTKEDKRRRNTAASARFRVKKKLREQALQKTADEMTEKAKMFESRVHELEREVQWLKALIVEKNDGKLEQLLYQQQYNSMMNYHRQQNLQ